MPTAQTVTVARVASKLSVNRIYQPLALQALKSYFDGCKRIVRQGDLIAVKIVPQQLNLFNAISETGVGDVPMEK
jgi:peroxin-6